MRRYLRWLLPGLGLKRWLAVSVFGVFLMVLGISLAVRINLYGVIGAWLFEHISYSADMFRRGPLVVGILALILGGYLGMFGIGRLVRGVLQTLVGPNESVAEAFYQRRYLLRGPKVVAIGGGTGIPTLLRGMKQYTSNIAAVVTVADDGGSSGRLRTEFGILPPGDIRNCLVALADTEPLMERLFQHRFQNGEGLTGHPFGNLFILAMSEPGARRAWSGNALYARPGDPPGAVGQRADRERRIDDRQKRRPDPPGLPAAAGGCGGGGPAAPGRP
jgi:hypothetical protein